MTTFLKLIDLGLQTLLFTKFESIFNLESINKGVLLYPKDIALREKAEKEGVTELEFINLWRVKTAKDWNRQNTAAARRGLTLGYTDPNTKLEVKIAKAVPVDLAYDIWFWSTKKEVVNECAERYLFWQHADPNLNLMWLDTYPAELDLHFSDLEDESTIPEKYQKGNIFCQKTSITVDGWIFYLSSGDNDSGDGTTTGNESVKSVGGIHLVFFDKDNVQRYSELIVEDSNYDSELAQTLKIYEEWIR